MDEHVIVRNPLAVAFVALLQWIVPSLLAVGALYFLVAFYDVDLQRQSQYHVMAALVAMLWMILSKPSACERQDSQQLGAAPVRRAHALDGVAGGSARGWLCHQVFGSVLTAGRADLGRRNTSAVAPARDPFSRSDAPSAERAVERAQCGLCRMHRSEPRPREGIPEQFRSLHARRRFLRRSKPRSA